jgi:hypothetical protein
MAAEMTGEKVFKENIVSRKEEKNGRGSLP